MTSYFSGSNNPFSNRGNRNRGFSSFNTIDADTGYGNTGYNTNYGSFGNGSSGNSGDEYWTQYLNQKAPYNEDWGGLGDLPRAEGDPGTGDIADTSYDIADWYWKNFGGLTPQVGNIYDQILSGGMPSQVNAFNQQFQDMLGGFDTSLNNTIGSWDERLGPLIQSWDARLDPLLSSWDARNKAFVTAGNEMIDPMMDLASRHIRDQINLDTQSQYGHSKRQLMDNLSGGALAQGLSDLAGSQISSRAQALSDPLAQIQLQGMQAKADLFRQAGMSNEEAARQAGMQTNQAAQQAGLQTNQAAQQAGLAGLQARYLASMGNLDAMRNFYNSLFGGALQTGTGLPLIASNMLGNVSNQLLNRRQVELAEKASKGRKGGIFG